MLFVQGTYLAPAGVECSWNKHNNFICWGHCETLLFWDTVTLIYVKCTSDTTIRIHLKKIGVTWISTRPFGETCYSGRLKRYGHYHQLQRQRLCYDRKEYVESISKVRRVKSTTGALQIGECHGEDEIACLEGRGCWFWAFCSCQLSFPELKRKASWNRHERSAQKE